MSSDQNGRSPDKKRKKRLNGKRLVLLITGVVFFVMFAGGGILLASSLRGMPAWDPAQLNAASSSAIIDKDGKVVERLHYVENRDPVDLDQVPQNLINAFIATEDKRFYKHHGIDFIAIMRAVLIDIREGSFAQGASTITTQLAKNAFIGENPEDNLQRKIQEAILAIRIERHYTKEEIMEYYLNWNNYGSGAWGVQTAAETYFGKPVDKLNLEESALLAAVVKAPSRYSPLRNPERALARRNLVLDNMVRQNFISPEEAAVAKKTELQLNPNKRSEFYRYPFFVDLVAQEAADMLEQKGINPLLLFTGGLKIYTTLDPKVQESMEAAYANTKNFPASPKDRPLQSAMVVMDVRNGEVRGLVGGREFTAAMGTNRAVQPYQRQPGSSIKPLVVYAPALEKGYTPASVVDDVPVTYRDSQGGYSPKNYDKTYRGLINFREALRYSVNIVAVKVLADIGVDYGTQYAKNFGLPLAEEDTKYLPTALGGIKYGVSPTDMAGAYATFANNGIWTEPHTIKKITDRNGNTLVDMRPLQRAVISEKTAYLMTDMLQTVVKSGTGSQAQMGNRPVAGKTGTTELPPKLQKMGLKGNTDAWFLGYTPELVGAVWMGYDVTDAKHYMKSVAGGGYPARLWKQVMTASLQGVPIQEFPRPTGIVYASVDAKSGLRPSELTPQEYTVTEVFDSKNLPQEISSVWALQKICTESNALATDYCPPGQVVEKVFLTRPTPYSGAVAPTDAWLEAPKTTCSVHGSLIGQEVSICVDSRHSDRPVLANIPGPGEEGGCPDEAVDRRWFPPGLQPDEYCTIPEHAIIENTGGTPEPGEVNTQQQNGKSP